MEPQGEANPRAAGVQQVEEKTRRVASVEWVSHREMGLGRRKRCRDGRAGGRAQKTREVGTDTELPPAVVDASCGVSPSRSEGDAALVEMERRWQAAEAECRRVQGRLAEAQAEVRRSGQAAAAAQAEARRSERKAAVWGERHSEMQAAFKGEIAGLQAKLQASGEGADRPQAQRGRPEVAQVQVARVAQAAQQPGLCTPRGRPRAREFDPAEVQAPRGGRDAPMKPPAQWAPKKTKPPAKRVS